MLGSPASWFGRSQVVWGVPARQFSASMAFAGDEHEARAASGEARAMAAEATNNAYRSIGAPSPALDQGLECAQIGRTNRAEHVTLGLSWVRIGAEELHSLGGGWPIW